MSLSELELRQLSALVDPLLGRLLATDPSDWSALARRETIDTDMVIEYLWGCRDQMSPFAIEAAAGPEVGLRFLTTRFVRWAYDRNQFFELDTRGGKMLVVAHRILLRELGQALSTAAHVEGFAALANRALFRFVERLSRQFRSSGQGAGLGRGAEYSPQLQMELLGLEPQGLLEPVLDLGCGKTAELVQFLRSKGLVATGIDRLGTGEFAVARDWFDVRFEPNSLGTIVSHLGFSLHFLHHHWHPGDRAYAFARKFMELLASLKPGGMFIYAPGLPFIEPLLDEALYAVEKRSLPPALAERVESLRDLGTGQSVAYVSQITKR